MGITPTRRWALLIAFGLLLAPSPASAQFNAAIQGTVVDSQGLVLPGAIVRITNVTTGVQREVVTTPDGVYRALSLAAGTYRVEVQLQGFTSGRVDRIQLQEMPLSGRNLYSGAMISHVASARV